MNGIRFGEVHSFEDLNLILSKVDLPPAAVKTVYVDNPGGDGSWDLTEATGKVNYKNREAKFTFSVLPEDDFEAKKTEVSNLLNGKRFKITLDKDPAYYWDGRCTVNQYESNKKMRKIVVGASVAPYKLKQEKTRVFVPFCGKNFASNNVNDWETIFNVSISNNVMTGQNVDGASNCTYLKTLLPRGTFVASGEFQGLVRFLVKLFDDNGNILTNNDILGFGAFNSYYKGFYFSETPKVLRIPNKAAYWQFGVVFTAAGEATNLTITNLQLKFDETDSAFEAYTPNTEAQEITLSNGRKTVSPTIICTGEANINVGGAEFSLGEGTHKVLGFLLEEGETAVTVSGTGSAVIVYQEGDL